MRFLAPLRRFALVATVSLTLTSPAFAQIVIGQQIGVDINSNGLEENGNGTEPNWTGINGFTNQISFLANADGLDLSTGNPISGVIVGLAFSGASSNGGINDLGGTADDNAITSAPISVTTDGAYGNATSGASTLTLTFSGLDNALNYNLEVFSLSRINNNADVPSINGVATSWASGFGTRVERYNQTTGAIFTGLTTNGAGVLTFAISDSISRNAVMNGAILTATSPIPEPSTYAALFGVCALGLAIYRRRSPASRAGRT